MAGGKIMGENFWTPGDGTPVDQVMTRAVLGMTVTDAFASITNALRRVCAFVGYLDRDDSDHVKGMLAKIIAEGTPLPTPAPPPLPSPVHAMPLRPLAPMMSTGHMKRTSIRHNHPTEIVLSPATRLPIDFASFSSFARSGGVAPGDTYTVTFRAPGILEESNLALPAGWIVTERNWASGVSSGGVIFYRTKFVLLYMGAPVGEILKTVEHVADESLRRGELVRVLTQEERDQCDRSEAMARLREVAAEAREHGVES